jgi:hypothetical protein
LAAALTYNLLGPPSLVAGDLLLLEPGASNAVSDVVRFNPAGTGSPNYPASLVFYSDTADPVGEKPQAADTGLPTAFYTNTFVGREVVGGGPANLNHTFTYTPTAGEPGFIAGFSVTYFIQSSVVVPEPGPIVLGSVSAGAGLVGVWWRRRLRTT